MKFSVQKRQWVIDKAIGIDGVELIKGRDMYAQLEKLEKNKSKLVSNFIGLNKIGGKQGFGNGVDHSRFLEDRNIGALTNKYSSSSVMQKVTLNQPGDPVPHPERNLQVRYFFNGRVNPILLVYDFSVGDTVHDLSVALRSYSEAQGYQGGNVYLVHNKRRLNSSELLINEQYQAVQQVTGRAALSSAPWGGTHLLNSIQGNSHSGGDNSSHGAESGSDVANMDDLDDM